MNSGFGQQKWENLRRGIPIFHNSSSSFRTASFSRLNSVQRATLVHTSGSTRVSSISLSLFSSSSILASVFFSSFSSFRLRACSSFCCLPGKLAVRVICFRCSGFSNVTQTGQAHIFPSAPPFSPDNNRSHQYNSQSPDGVRSRILVAV